MNSYSSSTVAGQTSTHALFHKSTGWRGNPTKRCIIFGCLLWYCGTLCRCVGINPWQANWRSVEENWQYNHLYSYDQVFEIWKRKKPSQATFMIRALLEMLDRWRKRRLLHKLCLTSILEGELEIIILLCTSCVVFECYIAKLRLCPMPIVYHSHSVCLA